MNREAAPPATLVLVVDDDHDLRSLFRLALRHAGLETAEASNGLDALQIIETQPVAVVVCDLGMPGMSGIEVVRALRSRPESSTLPFLLMTGSGDGDSVLKALEAGADDFLAKPVRLDELVARVRAHLRTGSAWREVVEAELQTRADAVRAIGQLAVSTVPEEAAETLVAELARRTGSQFVGILQLSGGSRLRRLATFTERDGLRRGGPAPDPGRARDLIARARQGPWAVPVGDPLAGEIESPFWEAHLDLVGGAPIHAGNDLVGILIVGVALEHAGPLRPGRQAKLLASVIDYASVLSVVAGPAIADRRQMEAEQGRLRQVLKVRAFSPVYQPIVALESRRPVGFEALTRFSDGVTPDVRFSEAREVGLAPEFELAAVKAAVEGADGLPEDTFLSLNVSPDVVVSSGRMLAKLIARSRRKFIIEVTEHAQIDDYEGFRRALRGLGDVQLAVDDAGAGYASLRHILELGPAYAKLDISLVSGIDGDPLRQALAAGLAHFAARAGCRLIAEGVERPEEARALQDLGVGFGQGYLFGRPEAMVG
jgi:EAL domain-containing protein (putative c-di-GMP-specific phosphodiesterase class I)/DNA-binding response OmpR family regulator